MRAQSSYDCDRKIVEHKMKDTNSVFGPFNPEIKSRRGVKMILFSVLAVHVTVFLVLLVQGCRQTQSVPLVDLVTTNSPPVTNNLPAATNTASATPLTNSFAAPTNTPVWVTNAPVEPSPAVNPPIVLQQNTNEYSISKGDTFALLAKRFRVSTKALIQANPGANPARLRIGQKILIPPSATANPSSVAATPSETAIDSRFYTVKSGDSLTRLASIFGTTPKAIRTENGLTTDRINVGQKLKIPVKESTPASPANASPRVDQTNFSSTSAPT